MQVFSIIVVLSNYRTIFPKSLNAETFCHWWDGPNEMVSTYFCALSGKKKTGALSSVRAFTLDLFVLLSIPVSHELCLVALELAEYT